MKRLFITEATYERWVRQCKGKIKHKREAAAESHRQQLEKKEKAPFCKYQCLFCGQWHVGHETLRDKETICE